MPFTLSHPATVLPFARLLARRRLLSAVVIGSMVPDFGWFLPWRLARFETHSADALLTFCLPAGLATYWVFQWFIKWPLIELLPPGAYARWRELSAPADVSSIRQWVLAACGVLLGAVTHLVWDAFTHEGGRGVRMFPGLKDPMVEVGGHRLVGVHLLEDVNSVVGLLVVITILAYGLRPGRPEDAAARRRLKRSERWGWIAAYLIAAGALSSALFLGRHHALTGMPIMGRLSSAAIAMLRGSTAAFIVASAALNLWLRLRPRRPG
jgi:Domain of unknown function (DUF4184)